MFIWDEKTVHKEFIDPTKNSTENYALLLTLIFKWWQNVQFLFRFKEAYLESAIASNEGQYIFNGRPATQQLITQQRLNEWYFNLFKEAKDRMVVHKVTYNGSAVMNHRVSIHFSYSPYISYYIAWFFCTVTWVIIKLLVDSVVRNWIHMEFDNNFYFYWLITQSYSILFQGRVNIRMKLKEKEEDSNTSLTEENLSCAIVDDVCNLWDFMATDEYETYQFTTVQQSHHATQALLAMMVDEYEWWYTSENSELSNISAKKPQPSVYLHLLDMLPPFF